MDWPRKMGGLIVCNQNAPPPLKRLPTEQGRRAEDEIGNPLDQRHCQGDFGGHPENGADGDQRAVLDLPSRPAA